MTCKCPYCGKDAQLVGGSAIYPHRPDLHALKFWQCEPCGAYVGCHKKGAYFFVGAAKIVSDGTIALGRLANAELRAAKQEAHAAFDPMWRGGGMTRATAYRWLAKKMGLPVSACHIGELDVSQCREVVRLCNKETGRDAEQERFDAMVMARWGDGAMA